MFSNWYLIITWWLTVSANDLPTSWVWALSGLIAAHAVVTRQASSSQQCSTAPVSVWVDIGWRIVIRWRNLPAFILYVWIDRVLINWCHHAAPHDGPSISIILCLNWLIIVVYYWLCCLLLIIIDYYCCLFIYTRLHLRILIFLYLMLDHLGVYWMVVSISSIGVDYKRCLFNAVGGALCTITYGWML